MNLFKIVIYISFINFLCIKIYSYLSDETQSNHRGNIRAKHKQFIKSGLKKIFYVFGSDHHKYINSIRFW